VRLCPAVPASGPVGTAAVSETFATFAGFTSRRRSGRRCPAWRTPTDGERGVLNEPRGRSRRPMRSINTKINHRLVLAPNERRAPGRGRFERSKLRLAHKRSSLTSSANRSARLRRHESDRQSASGTHSLAESVARAHAGFDRGGDRPFRRPPMDSLPKERTGHVREAGRFGTPACLCGCDCTRLPSRPQL